MVGGSTLARVFLQLRLARLSENCMKFVDASLSGLRQQQGV